MKRLVVWLVAAMAAIAWHGERALALSAEECADLSIRVKDLPAASAARCGSEKFGGGGDQGSGKDEYIQIMESNAIIVISHASVGLRTYLKRLGVKDVIGNFHIFASTDNWGEETESHDFAIRRFDATLKGSGTRVVCFGFAHFAGHVASTTGYRHLISGYLCDFGSTPPTDSRIDQLMGSIDYDFE